MQKLKTMSVEDDNKVSEEQVDAATKKQAALDYKEKGNKFLKSKEFESAIKMYSRAIELCSNDSVFYSNRSQCYLNMQKYQECIDDASKAIELDSKSFKSYYRRMTAYEKLGEDFKAMQSCRLWMELEPDDQVVKNSYDRIHNRIVEAEKKKDKEKIRWIRLKPSAKCSNFVTKPPHLSSKRPMKKVTVCLRKAASPIPEAIIDRIFDNNTGENVPEPETDSKLFKSNFLFSHEVSPPKMVKVIAEKPKTETPMIIDEKKKLDETNEILKASESQKEQSLEELEAQKTHLIAIPLTGPQFYAAWKELNDAQKFLYLKNFAESGSLIGKLLGAQLNSEMFTEIISITHKYFIVHNVPYIRLLNDLGKNCEVSTLAMFLENDEKKSERRQRKLKNFIFIFFFSPFLELNELLSAASSCGDNATNNMISEIKHCFQI